MSYNSEDQWNKYQSTEKWR